MREFFRNLRWLAITGDVVVLSASYFGAAFAVLGRLGFPKAIPEIMAGYPLLVGLAIVAFSLRGVYKSLIRYTSISTYIRIGQAMAAAVAVATYPFFALNLSDLIPWRLLPVFAAFGFGTSSTVRTLFAVWQTRPKTGQGTRVLIYGAGEGGALAARDLLQARSQDRALQGFVDDAQNKQGRQVLGVSVLGTGEDLPDIVRRYQVEEIIIAISTVSGTRMRDILRRCRAVQKRVDGRSRPTITTTERINSALSSDTFASGSRRIPMSNLLRRAPRDMDHAQIVNAWEGKRVLVTGAGGSIGSEISRTVAAANPETLTLVDMSEENLHRVGLSIAELAGDASSDLVLGDVANHESASQIFQTARPDLVVHAAAYKHVSLVENNPCEAILNNVGGAITVALAAEEVAVQALVNISTDKAVRPTTVMGATKRLNEIILQEINDISTSNLITVRFGNVLGSSGSLIPIITDQILAGGPVTVTDPKATRYFMLISEAAQLTLQAASVGKGGEVFVLDMGDPIPIQELVELLIYLHGNEAGKDIQIQHTGLRKAEKLHEELWLGTPGKVESLDAITLDGFRSEVEYRPLRTAVDHLLDVARSGDAEQSIKLLNDLMSAHGAPPAHEKSPAIK